MSRTRIPVRLRRSVEARASGCCEYCLVPEAFTLLRHQVDHVIAEKHAGPTSADNLALACAQCNGCKGSDIASLDPLLATLTPTFNPRTDRWSDHFSILDGAIVPKAAVGRVTVALLRLNEPDRIEERRLLHTAGVIILETSGRNHYRHSRSSG